MESANRPSSQRNSADFGVLGFPSFPPSCSRAYVNASESFERRKRFVAEKNVRRNSPLHLSPARDNRASFEKGAERGFLSNFHLPVSASARDHESFYNSNRFEMINDSVCDS